LSLGYTSVDTHAIQSACAYVHFPFHKYTDVQNPLEQSKHSLTSCHVTVNDKDLKDSVTASHSIHHLSHYNQPASMCPSMYILTNLGRFNTVGPSASSYTVHVASLRQQPALTFSCWVVSWPNSPRSQYTMLIAAFRASATTGLQNYTLCVFLTCNRG
jgi:hypothetical protein